MLVVPPLTADLKLPPVPCAWTTSGRPVPGAVDLGIVKAKQTSVEPCAIGMLLAYEIAPPSAGVAYGVVPAWKLGSLNLPWISQNEPDESPHARSSSPAHGETLVPSHTVSAE